MKLAVALQIDADRLREEVARARGAARPASAPRPRAERETVRRVDRRELDLLLYAVHEPELVVDWLDEYLFNDPVARAAFRAVLESDDVHEAIAATDGEVHDLLERVAVEEPVSDDEPQTLHVRLMANAVTPAAERVLAGMLRAGDERSSSVKVLLNALASAEGIGDWEAVQSNASQLLGWIEEGSRDSRVTSEAT
jgi:hypothetical protein